MVWSDQNEHLLRKLETVISKSNSSKVSLHIFVPKDSTSVPRGYPWVVTHESLTSEEDAAKVGLIVHILQKYDLSAGATVKNGRKRSSQRSTIYIVQNENEDYGELIGVLGSSQRGCKLKVLLLNSFDSRSTSPEKAHCKHCHVRREYGPRVKNDRELKSNSDTVNGKTSPADCKQSSENESNFCLLCGKQRQQQQPRGDLNIRFSRHFNKQERRKNDTFEKLGKFQNVASTEVERKVFLVNENNAKLSQLPVCSSRSPCPCLRASWISDRDVKEVHDGNEYRYCMDKLPLGNPSKYVSDTLAKKEERSRSSEEYNAREDCHCSEEETHVCLEYLLAKLANPPETLNLGRSESAPNIFFHGEFKDDKSISIGVETREKGTNTEGDFERIMRVKSTDKSTEMRTSTTEKSTNTPVERSTNTMHEKSTSTDDLEVKIVDKVEHIPIEDSVDASFELPKDDKKSFQFSCVFCPEKTYRSKHLLDVHMKNNHKKCNCPCQQYFKTREDYLAHFYFVYPLPCLVDKKCPERFRSLYYQSLHHRDAHYALKPFFCIPCYRMSEDRTTRAIVTAFKDIASLRIHASSYGHDTKDMYLASIDDKPDDSKLPFSMRCSGINYC